MKKIILFYFLSLLFFHCGNKKEQKVQIIEENEQQLTRKYLQKKYQNMYENRIMYLDTEIYTEGVKDKLKYTVDSLHLKFKENKITKKYYALPQAQAIFVCFRTKRKEIIQDIQNNISFDELKKKYNEFLETKHTIVKKYTGLSFGELVTEFYGLTLERYAGITKKQFQPYKTYKNKWILGNFDNDETIAFYFTEEFDELLIPDKYAQWINYLYSMADTTSKIILETQRPSDEDYNKLDKFRNLIFEFESQYDKKNTRFTIQNNETNILIEIINQKIKEEYERNKQDYIENEFLKRKEEVEEMYSYCIKKNISLYFFNLDEYANKVLTPLQILNLKRRKRPINFCGVGDIFQRHLTEIADLSAKLTKFNIFLCSRLDVISDREGNFYSNKVEASKIAFIKEIEDLEMNSIDLLLGTILKSQDIPKNHHFYGVIGSIFSKTKNHQKFEETIFEILSDKKLDIYNRYLFYLTYLDYLYYIEGNNKDKINKLKEILINTQENIWKEIDFEKLKKNSP